MLQLNKYLKEIGIDENYWLFDKKSGDSRLKPNKDGFVPAEFWNLDHTLAMFIYSHLCYFRDNCNVGIPSGFTKESWDKTLDDMIRGFKLLLTTDEYKRTKTQNKHIKYGLRLFVKYMGALWY